LRASRSKRPRLLALAAAFATIYIVWGSTYLAIKVAVATMPPLLMASARFLLAGLVLWAILFGTRRFHATRRQWRDNVLIGAFMLLGGNGLVVWAEQETPSGITTLVISLTPVLIVVAEWLLAMREPTAGRGSRPTRLTLIGLALGFIGLALLVWPALASSGTGRVDLLHIAALVFASLSWTIGSLASRNLNDPAEPFVGAAIQMLGGGMWLGLAGYVAGEPQRMDLSAITLESWLAWSYLLVAGSLIAFTSFVWLMQHCSPTLVATYAYVNPIVAVFLGWWVLDEAVGPRIFAAAAVIVAGVAAITYSKQRQAAKATGKLPQESSAPLVLQSRQ
jgi:drug/metabolite transporter (DMT)-like permease